MKNDRFRFPYPHDYDCQYNERCHQDKRLENFAEVVLWTLFEDDEWAIGYCCKNKHVLRNNFKTLSVLLPHDN